MIIFVYQKILFLSLYKHRSSFISPYIFPSLVWKIKTGEKQVYLTFDDGPTAMVTEKVLELLNDYDAKATFFLIGKNVKSFPHIFKKIIGDGHAIGNHTQNHLNGWKTNTSKYIEDIEQAAQIIESKLFRPPYGKLLPMQINQIKKKYRIIMWTALSGDFDAQLNIEYSLKQLKNATQPGAIMVFHDSKKAADNLLQILPEYLEFLKQEGYSMKAL